MNFFDSHCHLSELSADEVQARFAACQAAGVSHLMLIGAGYGFDENAATLQIAHDHPNTYCTLGMHPHDAKDVSEEHLRQFRTWFSQNSLIRAVGEIGLDYHYLNSPADSQCKVLRKFVQLAHEVKKPVVIHDRECGFECVDILTDEDASGCGGVVHCFTGGLELAKRYLDLGFFVSFSGVITFKKASELREVVKYVPLERMLIETDSPFLAPEPYRGKQNQPAWVVEVAKRVAEIKSVSLAEVAERTFANACELFRIEASPSPINPVRRS